MFTRTARTALALIVLACVTATPVLGSDSVFRFAILSDRTGGHTEGIYPRAIEEIALLNPDFVVTVGDHIEGYGDDYERVEAEWDTLLGFLERLEVPVHMTPGNHDIWDDESEAIYVRRTGQRPYQSFDHENTHFVVLDDSRINSSEEFPADQLEWLAADLEAARGTENIFVFFHKPLWSSTLTLGNPDPLHDVFVEHGVDAVFCGHLHHYFTANYDGIDYTVLGSSGGGILRPEKQPVPRGEFFQFGWVTVMSPGYELAVVDLGGIYPRDVVTTERLEEIQTIESEVVDVSALAVGAQPVLNERVTVRLENRTGEPLTETLTWDVPDGWTVEPNETDVVIGKRGSGEFSFTVSNPGELYPAPRVSCGYPLEDGGSIEVDLPLEVRRTVAAPRFDKAPVIDGDPDEPVWSEGAPADVLFPAYDAVVEGETEFRFGHDDKNLYLSAVCYDPSMSELGAAIDQRDGAVYTEDCVGFFFQPDWDEMTVYQLYFNALGTPFDQTISFDENMYYTTDASWDGEYEVATKRTDDRWSIEVRVPLAEFEGNVVRTPSWRLNFRRKQQRTGAAVDWQTPIDYDPSTFGEIRFE